MEGGHIVSVVQRDHGTKIEVETIVEKPDGIDVLRIRSRVTNGSTIPLVLTAVGSATIAVGRSEDDIDHFRLFSADSEWVAENRWTDVPLRAVLPHLGLPLHAQDGRGHFGLSSHGSWSTGEHLPNGVLVDESSSRAIAWQIESSSAWAWDLSQSSAGAVLTLSGPTDLEHQFAHELTPGQTFETEPVAVTIVDGGRDTAIAELTRYRRWLRRDRPVEPLPVVYNDFMNTLMGQPTTEALLPIIDAASDLGAEYFCIDAGWFAELDPDDWWSSVGEWRVVEDRFTDGFHRVVDHIRSVGLRLGMWLEPEVIGIDSPAAARLPDQAFFTRHGKRVVEDRRYHLDLRHPAARAHLDETVDLLVAEYGVEYLKLDYNINPGPGTDLDAAAPGDGLLGHTRALRRWFAGLTERHPHLLVENCSSGAMRADYGMLAIAHLQSTSDQQNLELYPPIAASAPASILPEQCGNWAYPSADMSAEDVAFTLVTGLSGRLYLSGFLHRLGPERTALVREAVDLHRAGRDGLRTTVPFWPLGLPGWDDDIVCLGLRSDEGTSLYVWDRGVDAAVIDLPSVSGVRQIFPSAAMGWSIAETVDGTRIQTPAGRSARVFTASS